MTAETIYSWNLSLYRLSSVRFKFIQVTMVFPKASASVTYMMLGTAVVMAAPLGLPLQLLNPGLANTQSFNLSFTSKENDWDPSK